MSKRTRSIVMVIVIVVAAVSVYFVLHRRSAKSNGDVKTAAVGRGNITVVVTATGTLNPLNSVQVGSQISGTVAELHADFNSRVRRGQLIALIDTTFLVASVRDAEASVQRARAQARQAEIDLERATTLAQKDLVSKLELETAGVNHESVVASLESAEAQLDRARINLKYASIRAPVDGVVVARNVDVGQTVAASLSAPTLFVIANDLKQMQLEANIDEADIGMIKTEQRVTFTVNAYPEEVFEGVVSQVRLEPVTVQDVVNYVIIVAVSNPDEKLMPGMTATLSVRVDERDNVLRVPNLAFRFKPPEKLAGKALAGTPGTGQTGERGERVAQVGSGGASRSAASGGLGGAPGSAPAGSGGGLQQGQQQGLTPEVQGKGSRQGPVTNNTKVIWKVTGEGKLIPVTVTIGVTDGSFTEVSSPGLAEGDAVAIGYSNPKLNQRTQTGGPGGGRMFMGGH
ncbi:MAG: efflux RND transporter periplasmic adaptor subunit [Candidatus Eisenbacteria bacterium]|nr:efflux RND transporter periplasmic adaptor subunit [Candidatus Eisenbacteria bacterium]